MYYVNWVSSYVGGKNVENLKKIFEHKNIIQYLG